MRSEGLKMWRWCGTTYDEQRTEACVNSGIKGNWNSSLLGGTTIQILALLSLLQLVCVLSRYIMEQWSKKVCEHQWEKYK